MDDAWETLGLPLPLPEGELAEIEALVGVPGEDAADVEEEGLPPEGAGFAYLTPEECGGLAYPPAVVKGWIEEGNVGTIVGAPGAAKTVLALYIAGRVALGLPVFGMKTRPGRVLYVAAEDLRGMHRRMEALARELGPMPDLAS